MTRDSHRVLHSVFDNGIFNLFAGAGISRAAPAEALVWRELHDMFIRDLFECMRAEGWPTSKTFNKDSECLRNHDIRPEQFWDILLRETNLKFLQDTLSVLNRGRPNVNHQVFARLMQNGILANVVTTNFDEYLEDALGRGDTVVFEPGDYASDRNIAKPSHSRIFKIHGSLHRPSSLEFTLRHLRRLPSWKVDCLHMCLHSAPLLIAGYSGFDEDVFPELRRAIKELPAVIVVVHPGTSSPQPVEQLAEGQSNVQLIVADINEWTADLYPGLFNGNKPETYSRSSTDKLTMFNTLRQLPIPLIPYLLTRLYYFSGFLPLARRYAILAEDACEDYKKLLTPLEYKTILKYCSLVHARMGDARMARFLASKSEKDIPAKYVGQSYTEQLQRIGNVVVNLNSTEHELSEAEHMIEGVLAAVKVGLISPKTIGVSISALRLLGRVKRRIGKLTEAVAAYDDALELLQSDPSCIEDPIELTGFCLDAGTANFELATKNSDLEQLGVANKLFHLALANAERSIDRWQTTQTLMMLAQVHCASSNFSEARMFIKRALTAASVSGDLDLLNRAKDLDKYLRKIMP